MLGFLGGLIRVTIGFVLSCLAAGAVQVLFAVTPSELADAGWEYWNQGGVWMLESATIFAVFALPFAAVSALISEWFGIRSFAYHGFVGIAIAIAGFGLITTGEAEGVPTIVNSYAMAAFLTTGLAAGFTYWLFAGRLAYRPARKDDDNAERPSPVSDRTGPSGLASPSAAPPKPQTGSKVGLNDRVRAGQQPSGSDKSPSSLPKSGEPRSAAQPPNIPKKSDDKSSSPGQATPPAGAVPATRPKPKTYDA